jgi:hypothetical protein
MGFSQAATPSMTLSQLKHGHHSTPANHTAQAIQCWLSLFKSCRTGGYIRAEYTIKYAAVIVIFLLSGQWGGGSCNVAFPTAVCTQHMEAMLGGVVADVCN